MGGVIISWISHENCAEDLIHHPFLPTIRDVSAPWRMTWVSGNGHGWSPWRLSLHDGCRGRWITWRRMILWSWSNQWFYVISMWLFAILDSYSYFEDLLLYVIVSWFWQILSPCQSCPWQEKLERIEVRKGAQPVTAAISRTCPQLITGWC